MSNVLEEHKLILVEVVANSNKFWHGKLYDDGSVYTEWGRVGYDGQNQTKSFGDIERARKYLASKRAEKEKKGYSVQRTLGAAPVKVKAESLIESDADPTTKQLLDYLVKVNIHQITSHTNIAFDVASGTFSTPLGIITEDGIDEAEALLAKMGVFVEKRGWQDPAFVRTVSDYLRIIPTPLGMKRPDLSALFPDVQAIRGQQQILDSLRASLEAMEQSGDDTPKTYRAAVKLVPHDSGEGTATFKRILRMYLDSKNDRHQSANRKLLRVYEIEIKGMSAAFESDGAKMKNIWELWHGTKAANLLSIMNSGYVVPRSGGSIAVTGRMFGDGLYFSDQSTKSLNYATGYWGGGQTQRTFMLLNDVAMGNYYVPRSSFSGGCRPGYDSTFAKAGQSSVLNNEMIVYRTSQVRPRYLCEFE